MRQPTVSALALASLLIAPAFGDDVIPHGQSRAPGAALSPEEAIKRMVVPKGFQVELVASEPDIVNPVAMTFDERGRVWITESLEYPRKPAGAGRDRVKVLEDTDGDGKADSFTIFADGLNIPSGIAVGHGGVWVANAPDILFLQDTDGDGTADRREVVVTGFGRDDTHELPNSLTWGPDGWLYGWNGVFNRSVVKHRGKTFDFTCAIFRIHPKTREFELFCEGTSNPWGIAFDNEGSAFASACVIDHLWHLTETGYYHRQGGPYPPYTWKIGSIVKHTHQKAAYCGIHYYDSDVYPPEYRNVLYMGNIHGNCVNADVLARDGSTYRASARPDLLTANDAWFMPVSQQTGPDGCLYILDWYDRYHCYQDANRDPAGIDRLKGRLYRVRYQDAPRRFGFDQGKKSVGELIALLGSGKSYDRETARRLLAERSDAATLNKLEDLVQDATTPKTTRLNALWAMMSSSALGPQTLFMLLADEDPTFRAWGARAVGNLHKTYPKIRDRLIALARDPSPDVQLQAAIAACKLDDVAPVPVLIEVAAACGSDKLIPHIVWQNLQPLLADTVPATVFVERATPDRFREAPGLVAIAPHAVERLLGRPRPADVPIAALVENLIEAKTAAANAAARDALRSVGDRVRSGEIVGRDSAALSAQFGPLLKRMMAGAKEDPLRLDAALLAATWNDAEGLAEARSALSAGGLDASRRLSALSALVFAKDRTVLDQVVTILAESKSALTSFRGEVLAALGRLDDDRVAQVILDRYPTLEPTLRPRAVELLTQRPGWRRALVDAVQKGRVPTRALNVNHVRKLLATDDPALVNQVNTLFGTVRETRSPQRERVIGEMRLFLKKTPGDPAAGALVFKRVCAQCHKIYGEGQEVGPEITLNGRGSYEQLLSNIFDPSLVIGAAYQGTTVATQDGRVITGLVVEDSPKRIALKLQGGKVETVARGEVEAVKVSRLSLMPEDVEKQLKPEEIADLFAYITLDRPPGDKNARPIPGAEEMARRGAEK